MCQSDYGANTQYERTITPANTCKMADSKLKVIAYENNDFSSQVGEYTLRFNPEKLDRKFSIVYDNSQAQGTSGRDNKYKYTEPESIGFEFLFDNTIQFQHEKEIKAVTKQVTDFKDLLFKYNGSIHRPNFLKLIWGSFLFKGQAENMNVSFTAFSPEGEPLRAKADVKFVQVVSIKTRNAEEQRSSPDLTHYYVVKQGDTLPVISQKIYGTPMYYLEIARVNRLNNFRKLNPGKQLILPPLKETD